MYESEQTQTYGSMIMSLKITNIFNFTERIVNINEFLLQSFLSSIKYIEFILYVIYYIY